MEKHAGQKWNDWLRNYQNGDEYVAELKTRNSILVRFKTHIWVEEMQLQKSGTDESVVIDLKSD